MARRIKVFVSYSHKDIEDWERLDDQLGTLRRLEFIEVWSDNEIVGGEDWNAEILDALNDADLVVLLISAGFISSNFCWTEEMTRALERHEAGEATVVPVLLKPCDTGGLPFAKLQGLPRPFEPISTAKHPDAARANVAKGLRKVVEHLVAREPAPQAPTSSHRRPRESGDPEKGNGHQRVSPDSRLRGNDAEGARGSGPKPKVSLHRLPQCGPDLFGRDAVLETLDDYWLDPGTNVVTVVAPGGVGKSALVKRWILDLEPDCPVFAWSFYSQGTHETYTSSDPFFDAAIEFFGVDVAKNAPPDTKAEALAEILAERQAVLILDGLEPMQWGPGRYENELKDRALAVLLTTLARANAGLCAVTTRVPVADLVEWAAAMTIDLEVLTEQAGAELLRSLGVKGEDDELREASRENGNHALAVTLLGTWIRRTCCGDVRKRDHVKGLPSHDNRPGRQADRIMEAYGTLFGKNSPEHAILSLLGLYDRPAPIDEIEVLRQAPEIPGLTDALVDLAPDAWNEALVVLCDHRLVQDHDDALDAHPLVREYFSGHLQVEHEEAWRIAHGRIYEHIRDTTEVYPNTVEGLTPLYRAIGHGCAAGRAKNAKDEVYWPRVLRGREYFSNRKLGAYSYNLAALSGFFDTPWTQPVVGLTEAEQAVVQHWASLCLRALGRIREAVEPTEAGLAYFEKNGSHIQTASAAIAVSQLWLCLGKIRQAETVSRVAMFYADRSGNRFMIEISRAILADILHQAGQSKMALDLFHEAVGMKEARQPKHPTPYFNWNFPYSELLLERGEAVEAFKQAEEMEQEGRLTEIALNTLIQARASLEGAGEGVVAALGLLDKAVDRLRQAGALHLIPRGLIARAEGRRMKWDSDGAGKDLKESEKICRRSELKLLLVDTLLERARLERDRCERDAALLAFREAATLVEECGYGRREGEVAELRQELGEG